MALVKCPECNRYMGAGATRCIYCGHSFTEKQPVRIEGKAAPQPTKIGSLQKNTLSTALMTVGGLSLTLVGFFFYPLGFLLQIAGGAVLLKANTSSAGYYQVCCPNCRRPGTMPSKSIRYRCTYCSEESTVAGSYLNSKLPTHIGSQVQSDPLLDISKHTPIDDVFDD